MFDSKRFVNSFVVSSLALAVLTACGGSKKEEPIAVTPPVAIAPTAQNDSATSVNNAVIDIDVLANDNAGSGDSLKLTAVTSARLGEVTIVDNKIRYTPSETFLGSDSFEYTITNSSGTATASVTVAGHQSLTLSGRVIDSPIADASVKVVINGETFSATADSQGFYTLSVLLTSLVSDEVIRVIAQGAEQNNQGFVTLSSLTDSAKNLLALRQTDNAVSNDEFSALKLTQITTARDLLIQQIAGSKTLTPAELAEADVSLDVDLLINTAAAIKLLVDNPAFSLPEGFETIEQFVLDTSAFTSFVAAASEGENSPLSQAKAATLSDPEIMPALKPFSGNFVLIDDAPAFMPARTYENVRFTDSSIVFVNHNDQSKSFLPVEKAISISGNVIDIIDPEKSGHQEVNSFPYFASYVPDEASREI